MNWKPFIVFFAFLVWGTNLSAITNLAKKLSPSFKKDTMAVAKHDTSKNVRKIVFPTPFIVIPSEQQQEYKQD